MIDGWKVFVEGKPDRRFVSALLTTLGIPNVKVERIGGGASHLRSVAAQNQIRRSRDAGAKIATILDADESVSIQRAECEEIEQLFHLDIERSFWLPNDADPGRLETLLERIVAPQHREVFECLDGYVECLKGFEREYLGPCEKGRIYAYCEAVGTETNGDERNYADREHWDLEADSLEPLRVFLRELG